MNETVEKLKLAIEDLVVRATIDFREANKALLSPANHELFKESAKGIILSGPGRPEAAAITANGIVSVEPDPRVGDGVVLLEAGPRTCPDESYGDQDSVTFAQLL